MKLYKFRDKFIFRIKERFKTLFVGRFRAFILRLQGAQIGKTTIPRIHFTWPHHIKIGDNCIIENNVSFKFDGIWCPGPKIIIGNRVFIGSNVEMNISSGLTIHDDCLIASGCRIIDHDHVFSDLTIPINSQPAKEAFVVIEPNVWLGFGVQVLKGVRIGSGAIVAAGAVVTKSIPENEIWAGVPAKKIGVR